MPFFDRYAYRRRILSLNPTAYWPLDEVAGTIGYDLSKGAKPITFSGGTPGGLGVLTREPGGALGQTGASTTNITASIVQTVTDNWTLEAWCRCVIPHSNSGGHGGIVVINGTSSNGYSLGIGGPYGTGTGIIVLFGGLLWWGPTHTIPNGEGVFYIAARRKSGVTQAFFNGQALADTTTQSVNTPGSRAQVGNYNGGDSMQFKGQIAHVAIYDTPLDDADILANYRLGSGLIVDRFFGLANSAAIVAPGAPTIWNANGSLSGFPRARNANGSLSGLPRARNANGSLEGYPKRGTL